MCTIYLNVPSAEFGEFGEFEVQDKDPVASVLSPGSGLLLSPPWRSTCQGALVAYEDGATLMMEVTKGEDQR